MYINDHPVFKDEGLRIFANSENDSIKHSPGIQVKKRANLGSNSIFLLRPHDRVTPGGRLVPDRPEGAAVLADHLQLVLTRSIIKGATCRSLCVP